MTALRILQIIKRAKLLLLIGMPALVACNRGLVYEETRQMEDKAWYKDSLAMFQSVIEDTSTVFNIGFSLEHNNDYPYSNMWLFVDVESPDGYMQTDTMEFFLAEPDGRWLGQGNDKSRTANWLYKPGVKLRQPGEYSFSVRHGMRRNILDGVLSLSLWIEEADSRAP
jgi:gliding motility-associated lipoprotein GldH